MSVNDVTPFTLA